VGNLNGLRERTVRAAECIASEMLGNTPQETDSLYWNLRSPQ